MTRKNGGAPDDILLWSALLLEPLIEACHDTPDRLRAAHDFLEPIVERLNLPRRASDAIRRIVAMLPRLEGGKGSRFKRSALFPLADEIGRLRSRARDGDFNATETHRELKTRDENLERGRRAPLPYTAPISDKPETPRKLVPSSRSAPSAKFEHAAKSERPGKPAASAKLVSKNVPEDKLASKGRGKRTRGRAGRKAKLPSDD